MIGLHRSLAADPTNPKYDPDYPGYYKLSLYGRQIKVSNKQYNNTETSLSLPGEDRIVFADELYQNIINLLEHFSGSTEPRRATVGQLWYDVSERRLKVFDDKWQPIAATTGINVGYGIGLYNGDGINKYGGSELYIKTIAAGKNIIIGSDDTSLTISTDSTNTIGDNIGRGRGEAYVKISDEGNLQLRSIQGKGNILVHYQYKNAYKQIELDEADANEIVIECTGEANHGCNVGCDSSQIKVATIFDKMNGSQLIFKTLLAGKNIDLKMYDKCDAIVVSTTAKANSGINIGCGEGRLFARKEEEQLQFRRLVPGRNINMKWECTDDDPAAIPPTDFRILTSNNSSGINSISSDNLLFCSAGYNSSFAITSSDGINWNVSLLKRASEWCDIANNGSVFCIISGNSNLTEVSSDGITWEEGTFPITDWKKIAANGSLFYALARKYIAATSVDGINWTAQSLPLVDDVSAQPIWDLVSSNGSIFCLISSTTLSAASADGIDWTIGTLPILPESVSWISMAGGSSSFCIISNSVSATSVDGINWTLHEMKFNANWGDIAWCGSSFCVSSLGSALSITSSDGETWSSSYLPLVANWSVVSGSNSIVGIFASTIVATSIDGINWEKHFLPGYLNNSGYTLVISATGSNIHGINVGCGDIPLYAGLDPFDSETLLFNTLQAGKNILITVDEATHDLRIKATQDFSNLSLKDLKNVSDKTPSYGQILVYRDNMWSPESIPGFGCIPIGAFYMPPPVAPSWFYSVELRWSLHKSYKYDAQPRLKLKLYDVFTGKYTTASSRPIFVNGSPYIDYDSPLYNHSIRTIKNDLGTIIKYQGYTGFVINYGNYSYLDVNHTFFVEFDTDSVDNGTVVYEIWFSKLGNYIVQDSLESEMADWIGISYNDYGDPVEVVMNVNDNIYKENTNSIIYNLENSVLSNDSIIINILPLPPQYKNNLFKFIINFSKNLPDDQQYIEYTITITEGYGSSINFITPMNNFLQFNANINTYEFDVQIDNTTTPDNKNILFKVSLSNPSDGLSLNESTSSVITGYYNQILISIEAPLPQYKHNLFKFVISFTTPIINNEFITYTIYNGQQENFITPISGIIHFNAGIVSQDLDIEIASNSIPDQTNLDIIVQLSNPSGGLILNINKKTAKSKYYSQDNIAIIYPPGIYKDKHGEPLHKAQPKPPDPTTVEGDTTPGLFKFLINFTYPLIDDNQYLTYTISSPFEPPTGLTSAENMVAMEPSVTPPNDYRSISWNGFVFCSPCYDSSATIFSSDGVTWNKTTLLRSSHWSHISCNSAVYCIISDNSNITEVGEYFDDTGSFIWSEGTLPASNWGAISAKGSLFCAISSDNSRISAISSNGKNWEQQTLPFVTFLTDYEYDEFGNPKLDEFGNPIPLIKVQPTWTAMASNKSKFCILSSTTISAISSDGIDWTQGTLSVSAAWTSMICTGSLFCAVSNSLSAVSVDGLSWIIGTMPLHSNWKTVSWGGLVFCTTNPDTAHMLISYNGVDWEQRFMPFPANWSGISWNTSNLCAISPTIAATSPDGITWTKQFIPQPTSVGGDFNQKMSETIYFNSGISYYELPIAVRYNTIIEHSKYFIVTLSNPSDKILLSSDSKDHWAQTKIINDDFAMANIYIIGSTVKNEGEIFSFKITLDRPLTSNKGNSQIINWAVDNYVGSAKPSDFGLSAKPSGTVIFGLNQTLATFDINTVVDHTRGCNRSFVVKMFITGGDPLVRIGTSYMIQCTILNTYFGHKAVFYSTCKRDSIDRTKTVKAEGYNVKITSSGLQVRRYNLTTGTIYSESDEIIENKVVKLQTIPGLIGPTLPIDDEILTENFILPSNELSYSMSETIITPPKYINSYIFNYNNTIENSYTKIDYSIPTNNVYVNLLKSNKPFLISILHHEINKIISSIDFTNVKVTIVKSPPIKYKSPPTSKSNLIGSSLFQSTKKYISTLPNKFSTQPSTNSALMDILGQSDSTGAVAWASYGYVYDAIEKLGSITKYGSRNIQDITYTPISSIVNFLNDSVDPYTVVVSGQVDHFMDNKELSWYTRALDKNRVEITAYGTLDGGNTYQIVYPLFTMVGIFGLKIRYSQRELNLIKDPNVSDGFWNYVVCLLNFEKGISDVKNHKVTNSNCMITTNGKWKYGLTLNGGHIVIGDNSLCNFDTMDFTIEFWYKDTGTTGNGILLWSGYNTNVNSWMVNVSNGNMSFSASYDNSRWNICNNVKVATVSNTWSHYAIVREANRFRFYKDGVFKGSKTSRNAIAKPNAGLYVGSGINSKDWSPVNGVIDDLRITRGIARYTLEVRVGQSFDVPTGAFPIGSGY